MNIPTIYYLIIIQSNFIGVGVVAEFGSKASCSQAKVAIEQVNTPRILKLKCLRY